jgi:hypothetical protein
MANEDEQPPADAKDTSRTDRTMSPSTLRQWQAAIFSEGGNYTLTKEIDVPMWVIETDDVVHEVLTTRESPIRHKHGANGQLNLFVSALGRRLLNCLNGDWDLVRRVYSRHRLSAYCELFLKTANDAGLLGESLCPATEGRYIKFVEDLRHNSTADSFKKQFERQRRGVVENSKSLQTYINDLFAEHSRLNVVRVDVGFSKECRTTLGAAPNLDYVQRCFKRFMKKLHKEYADLVGYARKLEYGPTATYHYHVLLFFNGNKILDDESVGYAVCDLWRMITNENGRAWNCNGSKEKYAAAGSLGIGMIHYAQRDMRLNLDRVAAYLVKIDHYVRLNLPRGARAFTHGVVTTHDGKRRGRRRSFKEQISDQILNFARLRKRKNGPKVKRSRPKVRK